MIAIQTIMWSLSQTAGRINALTLLPSSYIIKINKLPFGSFAWHGPGPAQ